MFSMLTPFFFFFKLCACCVTLMGELGKEETQELNMEHQSLAKSQGLHIKPYGMNAQSQLCWKPAQATMVTKFSKKYSPKLSPTMILISNFSWQLTSI